MSGDKSLGQYLRYCWQPGRQLQQQRREFYTEGRCYDVDEAIEKINALTYSTGRREPLRMQGSGPVCDLTRPKDTGRIAYDRATMPLSPLLHNFCGGNKMADQGNRKADHLHRCQLVAVLRQDPQDGSR